MKLLLQFPAIGKRMPPKREPDLRRHDFGEIYGEFDAQRAAVASSVADASAAAARNAGFPSARSTVRSRTTSRIG